MGFLFVCFIIGGGLFCTFSLFFSGYFDLNGVQFELMDVVFGIALGPLRSGEDGIH